METLCSAAIDYTVTIDIMIKNNKNAALRKSSLRGGSSDVLHHYSHSNAQQGKHASIKKKKMTEGMCAFS